MNYDNLISLAAEAGKATVAAAARLGGGAAWHTISEKIAGLWGSQAPDLQAAATALAERVRSGSDEATTEEVARWAARYGDLLQRQPESATTLRTLIGDINQATNDNRTHGGHRAVMSGRTMWSNQFIFGDNGTYIRSSAVGATAVLFLVAALVIYLVLRPDGAVADTPPVKATTTAPPAALADSCGAGLPPTAEPGNGADDPAQRQSYSYKVGSASGDGRDLRPGGSIRQAFVAGRPYLSQVSAIVGVANDRTHPIGFQITTLTGKVLVDAVENETPANNNRDVVHNIRPAVKVSARDVLLLTVTNKSREQVRFFVDPPIANQTPSPYAACVTGQAEMPARHVDLRGHILAGSVTAQDLA